MLKILKNFFTTPGKVNKLHLPQGFNIRVDSLLYTGYPGFSLL